MKLNVLLCLDDLPDDLTAVEFNAAVDAFRAVVGVFGTTVHVRRVTQVNGRPFTDGPRVNCNVPTGRAS
jgi:hypothetical protein